jgi:hypothetical protein
VFSSDEARRVGDSKLEAAPQRKRVIEPARYSLDIGDAAMDDFRRERIVRYLRAA